MTFDNPQYTKQALSAVRRRSFVYFLFYAALAGTAFWAHRGVAPLMFTLLLALPGVDRIRADIHGFSLRQMLSQPMGLAAAGALIFCLWTSLSALWSPLPERGDWGWRFVLAFSVVGAALYAATKLSEDDRARARFAALAGFALLAVLIAAEGLTSGAFREAISRQDRIDLSQVGAARAGLVLALGLWPVLAIIHRTSGRYAAAAALWFIAAVGLGATAVAANTIAFWFGTIGFLLALWRPRTVLWLLMGAFLVALVAAPFVAQVLPAEWALAEMPGAPTTWLQRLFIWKRAGMEIASHFWGGGVEYARSLHEPVEAVRIHGLTLNTMPTHPHNAFLHVWMDLGLVGALAFALFIVAGGRAGLALSSRRELAAPAAGIIAALFVYALVEWSIWQPWRFAALWIAILTLRLAYERPRAD